MRAAGRRSFTRLSHDRPPGGHLPPCPLSLVANGRAQPKDRGGIRENTRAPLITRPTQSDHIVARGAVRVGGGGTKNKKTHTLSPAFASQHAASPTIEKEALNSAWTGPQTAPSYPPLQARSSTAARSAPAEERRRPVDQGGPGETEPPLPLTLRHPLVPAHPPPLVASFKPTSVPQTHRRDEPDGGRGRFGISSAVFSEDACRAWGRFLAQY